MYDNWLWRVEHGVRAGPVKIHIVKIDKGGEEKYDRKDIISCGYRNW